MESFKMLKCTACGKHKSDGKCLMKMRGDWACLKCCGEYFYGGPAVFYVLNCCVLV